MKKSNKEKRVDSIYVKNNIEERIKIVGSRMLRILSQEFEFLFEKDEKSYQAACQSTLATLIPIWILQCFPDTPKQVKKMMFEGLIKNQENMLSVLLYIESNITVN